MGYPSLTNGTFGSHAHSATDISCRDVSVECVSRDNLLVLASVMRNGIQKTKLSGSKKRGSGAMVLFNFVTEEECGSFVANPVILQWQRRETEDVEPMQRAF